MQERIDDYLTFSVEFDWVVNPGNIRGYVCTADGMREAKDGILRTSNSSISVPISDLQTR